MVERGRETRFAVETFQVGFFGSQFGGQNFDDHGAAQFVVGGFINRALSAGAELLENLVIAESLPDHECRYLTLKNDGLQILYRTEYSIGRRMIYSGPKVNLIPAKEIDQMAVSLTEKEFSQHVGTKFRLKTEPREIELELIEVKGYVSQEIEQGGMERFSVFFVGPGDSFLPQQTYGVEHERMGEFEIFLVPTSGDDERFRYEAVFNYFKT